MNVTSLPGAFVNPLDGRLVTPRRIIGYRRSGQPIYTIAGGDGTGGDGGQSGGDSGQGGNTDGSSQQGGQSGGQQNGNQGSQSGTGEPQLVEQLPGWAQRVIADLRRENAARRASNNSGDGGQGNPGQQNSHQGDNTAKNDEAAQAAQATARESVVRLAAYKAASKNGADPDLLDDSQSFLNRISDLDPTSDDFSTKLADAIKKAVEDNPKLKAAQAAGRSGGEFTGGPGNADPTPEPGRARIRAAYGQTTS